MYAIKRLFKDCFAHLGEQALYESKDKSYMVQVLKQRSQTVKRVSEEKQIPQKAMRKKLRVDKANRKRLWSVVKLSSRLIGVAKLGRIKQTKIGAKVGSRTYEGAFIAIMKNGHIGIFKRRYTTSLSIDEIKVNTQARKIMKELVDNEVERVFEKYFDQQMSYMK
ncbi:phage tail protein [Wolbachia pipientis]|nr:phage tail protein [Wolbachia pipientis]